jgi:hypothetical protein
VTRSGTTTPAVAARIIVRSEGQRMLMAVTGSLAAIALEVGAKSAGMVHYWRTGEKLPSPIARARMQEALGIPAGAWSLRPGGTLEGPAPLEPPASTTPPKKPARIPTTLEDVLALLATIRKDRMRDGLMPAERVKLADAEARILALRARLEDAAQFSEARYVTSHPAWIRLKRAILKALEPHAVAARAVADAIHAIETSPPPRVNGHDHDEHEH